MSRFPHSSQNELPLGPLTDLNAAVPIRHAQKKAYRRHHGQDAPDDSRAAEWSMDCALEGIRLHDGKSAYVGRNQLNHDANIVPLIDRMRQMETNMEEMQATLAAERLAREKGESRISSLEASKEQSEATLAAERLANYNQNGPIVLRAIVDQFLVTLTTVPQESDTVEERPAKRLRRSQDEPSHYQRPATYLLTGPKEASRKARSYFALRDSLLPSSLSIFAKGELWLAFQHVVGVGSRAAHTGYSREAIYRAVISAQQDDRFSAADKAVIVAAAEAVLGNSLSSFPS